MSDINKTYNYRVLDNNGNFLATWDDVAAEPSFTQEMNSAGSEIKLLLARDPDTLGSDVEFNNKVIITVHDKETPEGQNLFQGFISEYHPYFSEKEKYTEVTLLGYGADLGDYLAEVYDSDITDQINNLDFLLSDPTFSYNAGQDDISLRFRASFDAIETIIFYLNSNQNMENFELVEDDGGQPSAVSVLPAGTNIIFNSRIKIQSSPDIWKMEFLFPFGIILEQGKYYHFVISAGSGGTPAIKYNTNNLDDYSWLFNDNGAGWQVQSGELDFALQPSFLTTSVSFTNTDPAEMLAEILDIYNLRGGNISYDGSSLEPTFTEASYTFKVMTVLECINKIIELCPPNFYFYIDQANNIIYLKKVSDDYEHRLVYGKNVAINNLAAISQNIVNTVYFTGGEIAAGVNFYKKYEDDDLIDRFGVKSVAITDNRVTIEDTADKIVSKVLTENNSPRMRSNIELIDSNISDNPAGIDIENIKVGEVISLANIGQNGSSRWGKAKWGVDRWGMSFRDFGTIILQIGRINYEPAKLVIEAKELPVNFYKQLATQDESINKLETINNPDSPS